MLANEACQDVRGVGHKVPLDGRVLENDVSAVAVRDACHRGFAWVCHM